MTPRQRNPSNNSLLLESSQNDAGDIYVGTDSDTADPDEDEEATSGPMLALKLVVAMRQVRLF